MPNTYTQVIFRKLWSAAQSATYIYVWWVLVNRPVKVDVLLVGHHRVAEVRQGHFIHNVEYKTLNRDVHILRQVHLVEFVEHLLEAIKKGVATHDANCFLCPYGIVILMLRISQLSFEAARALLVENKHGPVLTMAFAARQHEMMRLGR